MANERKQFTEKQIKRNFKNYEKKASQTFTQIKKEARKTFMYITIIQFDVLVLILLFIDIHKYVLHGVFLLVFGFAAAIFLSKYFTNKIFNSRAMQIELSEGYTQNLLDALYAMPETPQYTVASTTAMIYTILGNTEMALMELKKVKPDVFKQKPDRADVYYAALLIAQLLAGDLDHAAETYSKGFYYLNTYKASPISGPYVSLALGMYEYFCGHYDKSLQLLDIGMRAGSVDARPENRIPGENMTTMICYWKAINLASMGNKAAAWDSINYCKDFYKTPYYQQCCEKLLADMEKNHKSEMIENAETLP